MFCLFLLPDHWVRRSFGLHTATLLLSCVPILAGGDLMARGLGLALLGVAATLSGILIHVALRRPRRDRGRHPTETS